MQKIIRTIYEFAFMTYAGTTEYLKNLPTSRIVLLSQNEKLQTCLVVRSRTTQWGNLPPKHWWRFSLLRLNRWSAIAFFVIIFFVIISFVIIFFRHYIFCRYIFVTIYWCCRLLKIAWFWLFMFNRCKRSWTRETLLRTFSPSLAWSLTTSLQSRLQHDYLWLLENVNLSLVFE